MAALVLLATLLLAGAWPAMAADEVDYLALATLLTRDGAFDRAEDALAKVDPAAEGVDLARYHTVRGLIALERKRLGEAAEAFAQAIAAGQADPSVHLYRAQALLGLERYADALAALEAAGDTVESLSGVWTMRAHAHWMLGQRQAAMDTLSRAGTRFPDNHQFLRRQVFYLIESGLYQAAADLGRRYLERADGNATDHVAIATALRRSGSAEQALRFLETARLRFPDDGDVIKALAQTYAQQGQMLAAAELLVRQAEREPALFAEASELFRRAGHLARALQLNARIPDPQRRLKQRVGLLVQQQAFEQVVGLEAALRRVGLMDDEDLRYALAYARFKGGAFDEAERHLQALRRPELFRKATELRALMQDCRDTPLSCG